MNKYEIINKISGTWKHTHVDGETTSTFIVQFFDENVILYNNYSLSNEVDKVIEDYLFGTYKLDGEKLLLSLSKTMSVDDSGDLFPFKLKNSLFTTMEIQISLKISNDDIELIGFSYDPDIKINDFKNEKPEQ